MNVLPVAHACDPDSAKLNRKLPADDASHAEIWVMLSDVPPFVHGPELDAWAHDPDAAAA